MVLFDNWHRMLCITPYEFKTSTKMTTPEAYPFPSFPLLPSSGRCVGKELIDAAV